MPKISRNQRPLSLRLKVVFYASAKLYLVQGWGKFDVFQELKSLSFDIKSTSRFYEKSMPSRRMSSNFRDSDQQSTLEIPAADEIHMEDRNHGLA